MSKVEELVAANPFPGLRSFKSGEADRFFGREQQIEELVARLDETTLVAVAGTSGCGKSSLVLAGLLNELARRRATGASIEWQPVILRPGNQPIANLAAGLAKVLGTAATGDENRVASLGGRLHLGGLALVEAVRLARLEPHVRVLVVVDQFEEIFRFKKETNPEEAAAFVKLLLHAALDSESPVSVVLTLRTDALGFCAEFRDLPETINRGQFLVPRLSREQRKQAIIKPVELRGFSIAPRLVQRILNDVSDDFDDLPVMQHVLARTWQHWAEACQGSRPIDLEDYEATGTAAKALSNHADEAYKSLPGLDTVVERVFRALTERVAEGVENRRPLSFERLCEVTGCDKMSVEQVVERFRRPDTAFLMPPPDVKLSANPPIDISHESLIRQWKRLREWTQKEAYARAELLRLVDSSSRYAQKEGDLLGGRDLERALEWRNREQPTAAWVSLYTGGDGVTQRELVQRFLADSKKAVRRRRLLVFATSVALVLVGTVAAGIKYQKRANSQEFTIQAQLDLDKDPARSAHLALAAIDQDPGNKSAEFALRQSLATLEIAHAEHIVVFNEPIVDARFTGDKSRLVVANGKHVHVLDTKSYAIVGKPLARDKPLLKAWLIANNKLLVTLTEGGQGQIQTVDGGPISPFSCTGDGNSIYTLAVSGDERHIAAGCYNGEIAMWDVKGSDIQRQPLLARGSNEKATITALGFSADNKYLASGDTDGYATIWKLGQAGPWIGAGHKGAKESPIQHSKAIRDIAFLFLTTDSTLLATASDDRTAVVWTLDLSGRRVVPDKPTERAKWTLKHDHPAIAVRFTPRKDSTGLLMTISDKRVRFWEKEESRESRRHNDWVRDASVSDDGEIVVSASSDGTARVWSTRFKAPIAVLRGHRNEVTRAFFGPDGQILTASLDGTLRAWRLHPPLLLASGKPWMLGAAFDPSGKRVALCGETQAKGNQCGIIDLGGADTDQVSDQTPLDPVEADAIGLASWSADGQFLVGNKQTHDIYHNLKPVLWDAKEPHVITPEWLKKWRTAVFSAGRNELLTVDVEGTIAVWDPSTLKEENAQPKLQLEPQPGRWLAEMSPDGRWIAAIEGDRIALLDMTNPKSEPRMLDGHRGDIMTVKFSRDKDSDSKMLVTASSDRTARVWHIDLQPGQPGSFVELAGGHEAALSYADFNPDGTQVVTSSADGTIRVWGAKDGHEVAALRWHGDTVNEAHFTQDGRGILSASDDGTVKLGRCEACTQTIEQLRESVPTVAKLTDDEMKKIRSEIRLKKFGFKLPAFLSQE